MVRLKRDRIIMGSRKKSVLAVLFILCGILTGCATSQAENDPLVNFDDTVKTTEQIEAETAIVTEETEADDYVYALVKEAHYQHGEKTGEIFYAYDEHGRLIQVDQDIDGYEYWDEEHELYMYSTRADGFVNYSTIFEYDESGNVINKVSRVANSTDSPKNHYEYEYEFDDEGHAINCVAYYSEETNSAKYAFEFLWQEDRLVWEKLLCNEESGYSYKRYIGSYSYDYDSEGRVSQYCVVNESDTLAISVEYADQKRISKIHARKVGTIEEEKIEYSYDAAGKLLPIEDNTVEFEYDEFGNVIAITDEYGNRSEYEFMRINTTEKCLWKGSDIAIIRQAATTNYYPLNIPGLIYLICIFDLA